MEKNNNCHTYQGSFFARKFLLTRNTILNRETEIEK